MSDYTPISLIRGTSTVIDETSIVDGQILFDESRKCLFMDDGDTRSKYSGLGADSNVATVEDTTTSTHAYAKGDYVVVEGQLYEVTTAIAVGDTFSVGTNITQTTVGDELVQIKSDLTGVGSGKFLQVADKKFTITVPANSSAAIDVDITLPTGYGLLCPIGFTFNVSSLDLQELYPKSSSGIIRIRAYNNTSSSVTASGAYVWYLLVKKQWFICIKKSKVI